MSIHIFSLITLAHARRSAVWVVWDMRLEYGRAQTACSLLGQGGMHDMQAPARTNLI